MLRYVLVGLRLQFVETATAGTPDDPL